MGSFLFGIWSAPSSLKKKKNTSSLFYQTVNMMACLYEDSNARFQVIEEELYKAYSKAVR